MPKKKNIAPAARIAAGKDAVLENMMAGCSFGGACRESGYPKTTVYEWRSKDKGFDKTVRRLIAAQGEKDWAPKVDPDKYDWKTVFVGKLRLTQNRTTAMIAAGVSVSELEAALNPKDEEHYDPDFADEVYEILQTRDWLIEDQQFKLAADGRPTMIRDYLSARNGGSGGGGSVQVNVFGGQEGLNFARGFLQDRFGAGSAIDPGRLRGSPIRLVEDGGGGAEES